MAPRKLRFVATTVALVTFGMLGACWNETQVVWQCLNPVTGKETDAPYDDTHYVNGKLDPCHCYDPCGSQKTCPILVDAGTPPPECDAGDGGP